MVLSCIIQQWNKESFNVLCGEKWHLTLGTLILLKTQPALCCVDMMKTWYVLWMLSDIWGKTCIYLVVYMWSKALFQQYHLKNRVPAYDVSWSRTHDLCRLRLLYTYISFAFTDKLKQTVKTPQLCQHPPAFEYVFLHSRGWQFK